ncbi:molybdopterin-dependent oxidoreductase [Thermodesulfobacteriota bacterium]
MYRRREFFKIFIGALAGAGFLFSSLFSSVRWVYAQAQKTILPKGTKKESLINRDPKSLDAGNLDITNLKDFETMGVTDHTVDLDEWRLEITGRVKRPLKLTYTEILSLTSFEKKVLMICPGVFVNQGRWKGVAMKDLLEKAGVDKDVKRVTFSGPKDPYEKVERFPIEDVLSNKVFLAYEVNGVPLPKKHGFPLRVVAEDYYGDDWVKYVYKMILEKG